jgi:chemotaxis methyl-accepting protein methylase
MSPEPRERLYSSFITPHSSFTTVVEQTPALRKLEEALAEHYGWAINAATRAKVASAVTRKAGRLAVSPEEYCQLAAASQSELLALVEEGAVSETYFVREPQQYDYLRAVVLPELFTRYLGERERDYPRETRLRLWSAACSTGEEAYSLALLCDQVRPGTRPAEVDIFATDVRNRALLEASQATYQLPALRLLDAATRERYFTHAGGTPDAPLSGRYTVVPDVRKLVTFRRVNLLDGLFWKGIVNRFDLIVCANVLLYLHGAATRGMVERLSRSLREGGYLMVAPAEATLFEHSRLKPVKECEALFRKSSQ